MSNEFAHDVAMEWAKAHAENFMREPVEFGLKAAQVYLAAGLAFAQLPRDLPVVIDRLAALSVPDETLQLLRRIVLQRLVSQGRGPETQADAEGSA